MYQIKVFNGTNEYYLYDPRVKEFTVIAPKLSLELNKSGTLTMMVPDKHPNKAQILPLKSDIVVYEDGEAIWYGRSITNEKDFYKTGRITCEGELAFLYDSVYRPFAYTGTIESFLVNLIANHNSQVEARKQFTLGTVTVIDSNDNIARSSEDPLKTLDVLQTRLLDIHGGYLRVRHVGAVRYLDYVTDYQNIAPQVIEFGKNLIDLTQFVDATKIRTCLIPYGAEIVGSATGERVTIESVNSGVDYISNSGAVASFGQIWETVKFDDVTLPENLLAKAQTYLAELIASSLTLKLSAVDLSVLGVESRINVGDWVRVRSGPHGIDSLFLATSRNIDMQAPEATQITFGSEKKSFTVQNNQKNLNVSKAVNDMTSRMLLATQLITGCAGGNVVLDPPEKPTRILIMDTPDIATAQNVWQWNSNGLGHSSSGVNGTYTTAWTIDGHFNADFIDAGTFHTSGTVGGHNIDVTMSAVAPFELSIDGYKQIYVKNGILITSPCDINEDGYVDEDDINIVKSYVLSSDPVFRANLLAQYPKMDVNHSGTVSSSDLTLIARAMGIASYIESGTLRAGLDSGGFYTQFNGTKVYRFTP